MLVEQTSRSMLNRVSSRCEMKDMHAVVSPGAFKIPQRGVGCFGVSELRLLGDPPLVSESALMRGEWAPAPGVPTPLGRVRA